MGTGIVATAAATLPVSVPGLHVFGTIVWVLACILLLTLVLATALHWVYYRSTAAGHIHNPVMAHFYGAPAMAFLTVGSGCLLLGPGVLGESVAVPISVTLWIVGTSIGMASSVTIPYVLFTEYTTKPDSAYGGWLMSVVPPMVSAACGALLLPHLPEGEIRTTMLWACYAMFGLTLVASVIIISQIWARLAQHKIGPAPMVPSLWIVLGPMGQSITVANLLGRNAHFVVAEPLSTGLYNFGIIYGVIGTGFTLLWTALALAITVRTIRAGMPFSLTWWSFTFPVGTCVTGFSSLFVHTGATMFQVLAVVYYLGLLAAWLTVFTRTTHRALIKGNLLLLPHPSPKQRASRGASGWGCRVPGWESCRFRGPGRSQ